MITVYPPPINFEDSEDEDSSDDIFHNEFDLQYYIMTDVFSREELSTFRLLNLEGKQEMDDRACGYVHQVYRVEHQLKETLPALFQKLVDIVYHVSCRSQVEHKVKDCHLEIEYIM